MINVLRSRRFVSAIVGMLVLLVSSVVPELEEHLSVIAPTIVIIIGVLIGGYAAEDYQVAKSQGVQAQKTNSITAN